MHKLHSLEWVEQRRGLSGLPMVEVIMALVGVASSALAVGPAEIQVRATGAVGDGHTLDTAAIQRAIDHCAEAGGGTVRFGPGVYLSGPIQLKSNVRLVLDEGAILQASTNHDLFMKEPGNWLQAKSGGEFIPLVSASGATNIHIIGSGVIDGAGQVWWGPAEEARRKTPGFTLPRPNLIVFTKCRNITISGVTIQNSPKFHIVPTECENVLIENVKILAPDSAPNTDGIDPSISCNVTIRNCVIDVGDDNVAIKSGRKLSDRPFACENILVEKCLFKHGHGMSIGSETVGGVRNVIVRDMVFDGTENGIRIKSSRGRGGVVQGLYCENIRMTNVERAITITCYYPRIPTNDAAQPRTETTPVYKDITIKNLSATTYENAGLIIGLPESAVENVLLENVRIKAQTTGLEVRNATGVRFKNVLIEPGKGAPLIEINARVQTE